MKLKFFGDSYDIVKKSFIHWLGDLGSWSAHPMFTELVTRKQASEFSNFLGVPLLSNEILTPGTNRAEYFQICGTAHNLFLDPDTGVRIPVHSGARSVNYIFGSELVDLSHTRPKAVTLVFDQSYSRSSQLSKMHEKLKFFASNGVYGFSYSSHAPFLVLGADLSLVKRARSRILEKSGLPLWRLVGPTIV